MGFWSLWVVADSQTDALTDAHAHADIAIRLAYLL